MPNNVATTSQPALRTWMLRQSCAMMTAATVIETSTGQRGRDADGKTDGEQRNGDQRLAKSEGRPDQRSDKNYQQNINRRAVHYTPAPEPNGLVAI